jgi:small subunit ribosomal protein S17
MKTIIGKVLSSKTPNTMIVEVERNRVHPLYKKIMRRTKKYKVHYTGNSPQVGETVTIVETRPRSADKHFELATSEVKNKKNNKK